MYQTKTMSVDTAYVHFSHYFIEQLMYYRNKQVRRKWYAQIAIYIWKFN